MGYIDDYKERNGKCEYCIHQDSSKCADCYSGRNWGHSFEDSVDLYTFIRASVTKDAVKKFNASDEGKPLYDMMEQQRQTYNQCKDSYNRARDKFINAELKRIEDAINSITWGICYESKRRHWVLIEM